MAFKIAQITQNVLCQIDRFQISKYQLLKLAGHYNIGHFDTQTAGYVSRSDFLRREFMADSGTFGNKPTSSLIQHGLS